MRSFYHLLLCFLFGIGSLFFCSLNAQRITVSGNKFYVGDKEIWLNGTNTPWQHWNDFGGKFDKTFWRNHFGELHNSGINNTRVWILCDGEVGVNIDSTGAVSGMTDQFWADLDTLVSIAAEKHIYLMFANISFDNFYNGHPSYQSWRKMILSREEIQTYIDNYIIPLVLRYKDNPIVFSIDICNEIHWINEKNECGNLPWENIQQFVAMNAAAIHKNSKILVTQGDYIEFYSPLYRGNRFSNASLQATFNDPDAFLDFYKIHYYSWVGKLYGVHFQKTPAFYMIDDKPCVIGEFPSTGITSDSKSGGEPEFIMNTTDAYLAAYNNGWGGAMAWTSNGVDVCGNLEHLGPATKNFAEKHFNVVFPEAATAPDFHTHEVK